MESQGAILDRTTERLTKGAIMIVAMRRMLMARARKLAQGQATDESGIDYGAIRSRTGFVQEGQTWRDVPCAIWKLPDPGAEQPLEAVIQAKPPAMPVPWIGTSSCKGRLARPHGALIFLFSQAKQDPLD